MNQKFELEICADNHFDTLLGEYAELVASLRKVAGLKAFEEQFTDWGRRVWLELELPEDSPRVCGVCNQPVGEDALDDDGFCIRCSSKTPSCPAGDCDD